MIGSNMIDKLMRLRMSRQHAKALLYMYEKDSKYGFRAEEFNMTDESMFALMDAGWARPVNVAQINGKYQLMYQVNNLYEIINEIVERQNRIFKAEERIAKEVKADIEPTKLYSKLRKVKRTRAQVSVKKPVVYKPKFELSDAQKMKVLREFRKNRTN